MTGERALDRLRARRRPAGPSRCTSIPHRQVADLPALDDAERDEFGRVYLDVLRRFDALFDVADALHRRPGTRRRSGTDRDLAATCTCELFSIRRAPDKLKYLAGSESGMGAFVNDVPPEQAAASLRDALRSDRAMTVSDAFVATYDRRTRRRRGRRPGGST